MNYSGHQLNADLAKTDPNEDQLGFAAFAEHIARGICRMSPVDGITIGIFGDWGSGKTTMVNFVRHYVKELDDTIVHVEFNPWWFAGSEDMVRNLLRELSNYCRDPNLQKLLGDFSDRFGTLPVKLNISGVELDPKTIASSIQNWREGKSVQDFKKTIAEILRKNKTKYLVIVDDVDRLTLEEVRSLFRAIKSVADLPNVIYLMALDRKVVSGALGREFAERGDAYLKKIIQVPFDLPVPSPDSIARVFASGTSGLVGDAYIDTSRYWTHYRNGVRHLLSTPRDAVRLLNALSVTLPAVIGEVNIADFVAVEAIRVFKPELYERIRMNKMQFAGHVSTGIIGRSDAEELEQFHRQTLSDHPSESWQKDFLRELFPKLYKAWGGSSYGTNWLNEWRKKLQVCSPDVFETYFSFAVAPDTVSQAIVQQVVETANARRKNDILYRLASSDKVTEKNQFWNLIEKLFDQLGGELTSEGCEKLFADLASAWTEYKEVEGTKDITMLGMGNDGRLQGLLFHCLKRLDAGRDKLLMQGFLLEKPPALMVRLLRSIGRGYPMRYDELPVDPEMAVMPESDYEALFVAVCEHLIRLAAQQEWSDYEFWASVLWFVERRPAMQQSMIRELIRFAAGRAAILYAFANPRHVLSTDSPDEVTTEFAFDDRIAKSAVDVRQLNDSIEKDSKSGSSNEEVRKLYSVYLKRAEQLLVEHEQWEATRLAEWADGPERGCADHDS